MIGPGQSPCKGSGAEPPEAENCSFFMPNGSSKVASFSVFANFLDPRYCDTSLKKLKVT